MGILYLGTPSLYLDGAYIVLPKNYLRRANSGPPQGMKSHRSRMSIVKKILKYMADSRFACPANERRCYFVTTSLIGWVQTYNQPWKRSFKGMFWNISPLVICKHAAHLLNNAGDCAQLCYFVVIVPRAGLLIWVWRHLRLYYCDGNFRFT